MGYQLRGGLWRDITKFKDWTTNGIALALWKAELCRSTLIVQPNAERDYYLGTNGLRKSSTIERDTFKMPGTIIQICSLYNKSNELDAWDIYFVDAKN